MESRTTISVLDETSADGEVVLAKRQLDTHITGIRDT